MLVQINCRYIPRGTYFDPFSAAWVRDEYVKANFGEFAVTNNLLDRRTRPRP